MGAEIDSWQGLLHLLKASSKKVVHEICNDVVMKRSSANEVISNICSQLVIEIYDAKQLYSSLSHLLHKAIYNGLSDLSSVQSLFPTDFHPNLRDLLVKVILDNQIRWKKFMIEDQVSFPKLTDFSWKINQSHNLAPSCLLNIKTSDQSAVNVEMSKETLATMLDSLSKIREQISSIVQ